MKQNRVDLLVLKFNAWDRKSFIENALNFSSNSMIFIFDFEKIYLEYKGKEISFPTHWISYFFTANYVKRNKAPINGAKFSFFALLDIASYLFLFGYLCFRYKPKVCWIDHTWPAVITGLMKKIGFCDYTIYTPSDWLPNNRNKPFFQHLANDRFWPFMDYLACRFNDHVLNLTDGIRKARCQFWGRKIPKRDSVDHRLIKTHHGYVKQPDRGSVCFLGRVLSDSGLELAISAVQMLRRKHNIKLKLIGPSTEHRSLIKALVKENDLGNFIHIYDFIEGDKLYEIMADCFCGINLITSPGGHTTYTIPGKIIEYMQMSMPVVVTEHIGSFHSVIKTNKIGCIVEPEIEAVYEGIMHIFENLNEYEFNIENYIKQSLCSTIQDFIIFD